MGDDDDNRKFSLSDCELYQPIPDADREMANSALLEFEQNKFDQCLHLLKKLSARRPQDSKVFHNIAVTEYCLSNFKKTDVFKKKMVETCKQAHIDLQDLESMDDVDNCVVLYNQAVVLFHLHQYHSAISILDKVFQFIEPLDENLARNICFLLLELNLCICQPKKALYFASYLETILMGNKNCKQSSGDNSKDDVKENIMSEGFKRRLQLGKARCYAMLKTSKACKREIKNIMSTGTPIQNIPAFYLKSQLEYLRGNYRKAIKLLNSVTLPEDISKFFKETGDFLPAAYYNNVGCIHFYMGKPNLGHFYIQKALNEFNAEITTMTIANENKMNVRPLQLMSISTQHQLTFNLGMQFIHARRHQEAFSCFKEVLRSYHSNPRLWLRIAECCIQIHQPDNIDQYVEYKRQSFVKSVVGAGPHQKLILNSSSEKTSSEDSKSTHSQNLEGPSLHFAILCLKNALFLLGENCTTSTFGDNLSSLQSSTEDNENSNSTEENNTLSTLPSNFLQGMEVASLRNSILAAASYVSLCLGDVIPAHEYAKTLLQQPRISSAHKFLGHLYAGESLLLMDKITEAVEHLNQQFPTDIELAFSVSSTETSMKHQTKFDSKLNEKSDDGSKPVGNIPNWFPNTISSAKFIIQYNLAVAYAVREEWSKSLQCLYQMNPGGKIPPQALSLLIYVQTHQGCAEDTKSYVKQYLLRKS